MALTKKQKLFIEEYLIDLNATQAAIIAGYSSDTAKEILYQDREGNIFLKSSFIPDMEASSVNETYFSHAGSVQDKTVKKSYALSTQNYISVTPTQFFLPRKEDGAIYLNVGYVSESVAGSEGFFVVNPTVEINLEASFKCFGLTLEFGNDNSSEMVFHTYHDGELVEDYAVTDLTATTVISHEFEEFDRMVLEFTKGSPNNRVILNNNGLCQWLEMLWMVGLRRTSFRRLRGKNMKRKSEERIEDY